MKFREIFRFEFAYQARRVRTWLYFAILFVVANRLRGGGVNSLFTAAQETLLLGLLWALMAPAVAGGAAARDVQTRMHPLVYTAPIRKADYLGGRFLAAFGLNALILLAVPLGMLVDFLLPGGKPEIIGPFPPVAYFGAYGFLALPTAFIFTAVQFAFAALTPEGRLQLPWHGAVLRRGGHHRCRGDQRFSPADPRRAAGSHRPDHSGPDSGDDADRDGSCPGRNEGLDARQSTPLGRDRSGRLRIHLPALSLRSPGKMMRGISIPPVRRTFGFATHARQTGAIAWTSFWAIAKSPAGLVLPAVAMLLVLLVPVLVKLKGVSLLPTTALVLSKLIAPVADNPRLPWVLIPLLIIYWAGELVWRERDAGMGEIADATPVREWVLVLGKFLGLALVLVGWMALLIAAGVLVQMRMGYFDFELGLYLRILFGLQLVDYLLFALLVLVVHAVVNQKQLGYLAALVAYGVILFPSFLGIEHHLLIYGSGPRWSYSVRKRLRPVPRAVAVVQAVLGGVGGAAGRSGEAAVAARRRARSEVAAPLGAPAIHSSDGRRGRNGGDAHPLGWAVSSFTTPTC